jgi:signal transduction histidine kinase
MAANSEQLEQRVLVLAPIGRDARAAAQHLAESKLDSVVCDDVDDLLFKLGEGAAIALVTEEAFLRGGTHDLEKWIASQPPWSDFPFIVLTSRATSAAALAYRMRLLERLGNVSLLERPLNAVTLMSAVHSAMRARRRQYEVPIAERKQVEAALQQAQKMEVIGQMTGGVAHDFNNLLTAVLGNLELATRRGKDENIRRYLEGATQAAARGAKITSQLLAFSRTQRLQTEPIDLNAIVTAMGDLLFRTIGATVRIETILERNLWLATADRSQIESVLLNLAVNARDAMPQGGRLTVTTANIPHGHTSKAAELAAGDYVGVFVSDTGTGMSEEVLRKAFEPFFTTKPVGSGTGLGLSQVYGIAKQTGGTVTIDTKVGQGTTVSVYLPRTTALPVERPADDAPNVPLGEREATILIVDDDKDVRQLGVSCLESLGYQVLAAGSGHAALDIVASDARIDMVLIDIAMPEITGVEAMEAILRKRPRIPYLYMTGYVGPTKLDPSEQRILKKPFTIAELAAKVEETLFPKDAVSGGKVIPLVRPAS